jgi:UPF0148 protein
MQQKTSDERIKKMAELLFQGATLTDLACPRCSSPLLRLKDGTLWCGQDEMKVELVKEGEKKLEEIKVRSDNPMDNLEATIIAKVQNLQVKIEKTDDLEELGKLTSALSELLNSLEKIRKMKMS